MSLIWFKVFINVVNDGKNIPLANLQMIQKLRGCSAAIQRDVDKLEKKAEKLNKKCVVLNLGRTRPRNRHMLEAGQLESRK